jgi:anti-sigma regulatory factor (Ser/Thr protein kinase)
MINFPTIFPKIRRSLLIIDLASLAVSIWFNIMEPELKILPSTIGYILLFTTAISPFIAVLPVDRSLWQKRAYIILALVIITTANHYRLFTDNLNFIFLFKGCFLLPRWEIVSIAIVSLIAAIFSFVVRAPEIFERSRQRNLDAYLDLSVQIELAQRLQSTEPERAQQSIDLAKKLSSQALDNVRQALGTMKRSNFDLTEAIIALAEQNQPFQIHVDVKFPILSLQSSYQLYCILQESLTNIQKHAQADRVTITGSIINNGTILEICDNGKGFSLVGVASAKADAMRTALPNRPHAGFGLRNMKERVQCLGGNFNLDSEVGQGTRVKIFVPASN